MATTANIDKTARTAYEMAEAQRDAFEAVVENFAAAQRRSIGIAEGGLEFVRLQEQNARAAQEFFADGVRLLGLQQRNAEFVQSWIGDAVEVVRDQTEQNARTAEAFARTASSQQESMRALTRDWVGAYRDFFSPFAYVQQGMRAFQRATQQGLEATEQVARQGLRASEEATRQGGVDRGGDHQEDRGPSHRAAQEGARVREEAQEPRDPHRADRPQDKGQQLLRRALQRTHDEKGRDIAPGPFLVLHPLVARPGELLRTPVLGDIRTLATL
jgi:hypothetical protein